MTVFACEETYPNQKLRRVSNGYVWDLNGLDFFQMHFDENGVFVKSLQEDCEGNVVTFTKPNGITPEPLTKEQMEGLNLSWSFS